MKKPTRDYYSVLEVSPAASQDVIKAAYHALLKAGRHPDVGGRNTLARDLIEAYEVLSDPVKRAEYDASRIATTDSAGEYRILEMIAEGGFGITYKGEHVLTGEPVCIKHCLNVSPEHEVLLIQEAKNAWKLRHYAIPVIHNVVRMDGKLALVMSYIPGPTVEQIVKKVGRLDPEHVAWITERVLNVLMYMHHHAVVHGDIKPQNIIVQPESHMVVVVDFGLSMVKPKGTAVNLGYTPLFASPEQIAGLPLLPESDFYSLGMTMIYALAGGYDKVEKREVPDNVPDAICAFVRRLIVRDPLARPNWEKENLFESFQSVRMKAFDRARSGMKPIPGL